MRLSHTLFLPSWNLCQTGWVCVPDTPVFLFFFNNSLSALNGMVFENWTLLLLFKTFDHLFLKLRREGFLKLDTNTRCIVRTFFCFYASGLYLFLWPFIVPEVYLMTAVRRCSTHGPCSFQPARLSASVAEFGCDQLPCCLIKVAVHLGDPEMLQ